jgi:sugar O-acyltransferase (sialic acid O-acetyltransferase NeuD family)
MTYIIGAGGNAQSIASVMCDLNISVSGFVVDDPHTDSFLGNELINFSEFGTRTGEISCVISIGHNTSRKTIYGRLLKIFGERINFPTLVHPTSYVAKTATIGEGSVIFPLVTIGPSCTVSNFVHLNTHSIVEHGSQVGEFASLAPGAILGGNTKIGRESAILMNASISNGSSVGECAVIGANSFLKTSTGGNELWVGIPARLKRVRVDTDPYF